MVVVLAREIVLDRQADAQAADQERGQAGDREILGQPVGEPGDPRLHVAPAARPPRLPPGARRAAAASSAAASIPGGSAIR